MNNIVIELSAEDRARLDRIASLLERIVTSQPTAKAPEPVAPAPADMEGYTMGVPASPVDQPPWEEPKAPAPEAPAPAPISLAEFQKVITKRCVESAKVKEAVKALINQYSDSVSAVPEDKRAEVLAKLAQI